MALKIGNATVANNAPNVSWTIVSSLPSNLVSNIRIQGTGTTTLQVNTSIEGIIIFTKT